MCRLVDYGNEVAAFNLGGLADGHAFDHAILSGGDGSFHLHCLNDGDLIAGLNLVARLGGGIDHAGEWCGDMSLVGRVSLFYGGDGGLGVFVANLHRANLTVDVEHDVTHALFIRLTHGVETHHDLLEVSAIGGVLWEIVDDLFFAFGKTIEEGGIRQCFRVAVLAAELVEFLELLREQEAVRRERSVGSAGPTPSDDDAAQPGSPDAPLGTGWDYGSETPLADARGFTVAREDAHPSQLTDEAPVLTAEEIAAAIAVPCATAPGRPMRV